VSDAHGGTPGAHGEGHGAVHYEKKDVAPGAILRFGGMLALLLVLCTGGLYLMFRGLLSEEMRRDPPPPPLTVDPARRPPEPRLQQLPFADIRELRSEQNQLLESYGWIDRKAGVVHIKIEDAMTIVAQRGLPTRSQQPSGQEARK